MEEKFTFHKPFLTIADHFSISDEDKQSLSTEVLALSYDRNILDIYLESISRTIKIKTTYDKIVFGQLIMIEQLLTSKMDNQDMIIEVLNTFFRPNTEDEFDNTDDDNEEIYKNLFMELPVVVVFGLFEKVMSCREEFILKKYKGVIYSTENAKEDVKEDAGDTFEDAFYRNFGWYEKVRHIAKELNMTPSQVTMMSSNDAMIELSYQKNKYRLDEYRNKNK